MKDKKMFAFYESYARAINELPSLTDRALMSLAIIDYGVYGKEPEFPDTKTCPSFAFRAIFETCRVNLDNSRKSYENGYRGAEHGKKGGRPRKGETAAQAAERRIAEANGIEEAPEPLYPPLEVINDYPEADEDARKYEELRKLTA